MFILTFTMVWLSDVKSIYHVEKTENGEIDMFFSIQLTTTNPKIMN